MNDTKTPITDKYLESLAGIKAAEPSQAFYNRVMNRLEHKQQANTWAFPLKPIWMISALALLLLLNSFILTNNSLRNPTTDGASIESFAKAYDQNISSY